MCERHAGGEPLLLRNLIMKIYGKWLQDTLGFYLFLGRISKLPAVGPVVRFFAGQYGKYLHGGRAATPAECEELLRQADYIAVIDCSCRVKYNRCDNARGTCITVGRGARVLGQMKKGDFITKERALQIIMECCQKGLIRTVTHCTAPEVYAICNCCTCCCVPYRLRTEFGIKNAVQEGAMAVDYSRDNCRLCRKCTEICPEKAINPERGQVLIERCIGCGLCVGVCSHGALRMVNRVQRQHAVSPGIFARIIMYGAFFTVILPLAVGYKLLHR